MSNSLIISYDLITPGQRYETVIAKIKETGSWAKIQQSLWYVDSTFTATQARDFIKPVMDANDKLFVVDATNGDAAWYGLSESVSTHIRDKWSN